MGKGRKKLTWSFIRELSILRYEISVKQEDIDTFQGTTRYIKLMIADRELDWFLNPSELVDTNITRNYLGET
jgi:hypothetical protein